MADAEGKNVPLTVDNICRELEGVDCIKISGLGDWLKIPRHKLDEIKQQHSTQANQTRATVEYWLSVYPTPSWRRLLTALEWSSERRLLTALEWSSEREAMKKVEPYMEPLPDASLTTEYVSSVLKSVTWWKVCYVLMVPPSRRHLVEKEHSTKPQQKQAAVDWWLQYSPTASWTWLAGRLHYWNEKIALKEVSCYIVKETADSTLNVTSLWSILIAVKNENWWTSCGLCAWLNVPWSVKNEIKPQTSDVPCTQQKKTLLEWWLQAHPAPSWAVVAEALYRIKEHDVLEQVKKFITGKEGPRTGRTPQCQDPLRAAGRREGAPGEQEEGGGQETQQEEGEEAERAGRGDGSNWCARQPVPGPPGTVTFIVSYEVHISTRIEQPKLCLHIRDAGLEKAAANLHYTNSHPAIAFPCTCSQEELHPATVSDDKTSRLYSIGDDKQDKLDETQLMWISLKCAPSSTSTVSEATVTVDRKDISMVVHETCAMLESATLNHKADQQLREDNCIDIMGYLHTLDKSQLSHLGMVLGLSRHRVKDMKDSDSFLEDIISLWLQQADNVMTRSGVPTWRSLVKALRHDLLGQNGIASQIATDKNLE